MFRYSAGLLPLIWLLLFLCFFEGFFFQFAVVSSLWDTLGCISRSFFTFRPTFSLQKMRLSLVDLLNPSDAAGRRAQALMQSGLIDIQPQLQRLARFRPDTVSAPLHIQQHLLAAIEYLEAQEGSLPASPSSSPAPAPHAPLPPPPTKTIEEHGVRLTNKTTLSKLYRYPLDTVIEYPETSCTQDPVGHLFRMDPDDWQVPDLNIVYSRGEPMGRTLSGKEVFFDVMVDGAGNRVPCMESHSTCSSYCYNVISFLF